MTDPIHITAHDWHLRCRTRGGMVLALDWRGMPVLRRAPDATQSPVEAACFPLVPYCNRIAHGRFSFDGAAYQLPPNHGDHPHSLHGVGWLRDWQLEPRGAVDEIVMALDHAADADWPWQFTARQRVKLAPAVAQITLEMTNTGDRPMPAGVGLHPYFPRDDQTRLSFQAEMLWDVDAGPLPTWPIAVDRLGDWAAGARVDAPSGLIDNAYSGWSGSARIDQPAMTIDLHAIGARAVHLYHPQAADFFCVEPVSHLPDAINRPDPFVMDRLNPGETLSLTMSLSAAQPGN